MPKATITLESGAVVDIEGTVEEVQKLFSFYGGAKGGSPSAEQRGERSPTTSPKGPAPGKESRDGGGVEILTIVNLVKSCDEADDIEKHILDNQGRLPRVLLPLYVVHEHLDNAFGLTSGDIAKITAGLGIPLTVANASTTLASQASKYVIGDKVRKNGQPVRYKLSRRGIAYFKNLLNPKVSAN